MRIAYKIDLTGQKFGRLTALRKSDRIDLNRTNYWECICDCGNTYTVRSDGLRNGVTKSCGCYKRDRQAELWDRKVPRNQAAINRVLSQYISNAVNRGFTFQLTKDEFMELSQQNCHYCDTPPSNVRSTPRGSFTYNGVDRVNNENGYTMDNVVTCCRTCNMLKQGMEYEEFIAKTVQIANHVGRLTS